MQLVSIECIYLFIVILLYNYIVYQ